MCAECRKEASWRCLLCPKAFCLSCFNTKGLHGSWMDESMKQQFHVLISTHHSLGEGPHESRDGHDQHHPYAVLGQADALSVFPGSSLGGLFGLCESCHMRVQLINYGGNLTPCGVSFAFEGKEMIANLANGTLTLLHVSVRVWFGTQLLVLWMAGATSSMWGEVQRYLQV